MNKPIKKSENTVAQLFRRLKHFKVTKKTKNYVEIAYKLAHGSA